MAVKLEKKSGCWSYKKHINEFKFLSKYTHAYNLYEINESHEKSNKQSPQNDSAIAAPSSHSYFRHWERGEGRFILWGLFKK